MSRIYEVTITLKDADPFSDEPKVAATFVIPEEITTLSYVDVLGYTFEQTVEKVREADRQRAK